MDGWRAVDWQRPWLAPYRALGEAACVRLDAGDSVARSLDHLAGAQPPVLRAGALRFVAQAALPEGEAYEAFIARSACVPTRDTLHDLFNGLVWLRFPRLKRHLNELQSDDIAQRGVQSTRGALRDALTLFDENAALWQAGPELVAALRARDWHGLFVARRTQWQQAPLTLFGHALMEKLVHPRKAATAHVWLVPPEVDVEAHLLQSLTPQRLAQRMHLPLPVLGVPGWWPANEAASFYDDRHVFRAPQG